MTREALLERYPESRPVLDKGYVRLVDRMGTDLTVANAARVSFDKQSRELSARDRKLISFLAEHGHTSPFRHAMLQFEMYCPLMVARQHYKYVVGSDHTMDAWNESSRRYVTEEPTFYIPGKDEWREATQDKKQGSGACLEDGPGSQWTKLLLGYVEQGEALYKEALDHGVCAEQARLFLPAYGMYVRYYWTASLQSVCHFLNQRLNHDAQAEIQAYAHAVYELSHPHFPASVEELCGKIS